MSAYSKFMEKAALVQAAIEIVDCYRKGDYISTLYSEEKVCVLFVSNNSNEDSKFFDDEIILFQTEELQSTPSQFVEHCLENYCNEYDYIYDTERESSESTKLDKLFNSFNKE